MRLFNKERKIKCPSLYELKAMEREKSMRQHTERLQNLARKYGLNDDDTDIWALARRVSDFEDKRDLPKAQEEARSLGLSDKGSIYEIRNRIWDNKERRRLLKQYGFTDCL